MNTQVQTNQIEMPLGDAARIFAVLAMFAASPKERVHLSGIQVSGVDGKLVLSATDSHAAARFTATDWVYGGEPFILPAIEVAKCLGEYAKMFRLGRCSITAENGRYNVEILGRSSGSSGLLMDGPFLAMGSILTTAAGKNTEPFTYVGIGAERMLRLGKAAIKFSGAPLVLTGYHGPRSPLLFTQSSEVGVLTIIQMPVRVTALEGTRNVYGGSIS